MSAGGGTELPSSHGALRAPLDLKLSPSKSHIFKTVSQEVAPVMNGAATSQRTAAVPAKAPGAARLSLGAELNRMSAGGGAEAPSSDGPLRAPHD